jgi:hypothetical protein
MEEPNNLILMEPETSKSIYWIVKPTIDIDRRMTAVFPVNVISSENVFTSVSFSVEKGKWLPSYSYEWIKNEVEKRKGSI